MKLSWMTGGVLGLSLILPRSLLHASLVLVSGWLGPGGGHNPCAAATEQSAWARKGATHSVQTDRSLGVFISSGRPSARTGTDSGMHAAALRKVRLSRVLYRCLRKAQVWLHFSCLVSECVWKVGDMGEWVSVWGLYLSCYNVWDSSLYYIVSMFAFI